MGCLWAERVFMIFIFCFIFFQQFLWQPRSWSLESEEWFYFVLVGKTWLKQFWSQAPFLRICVTSNKQGHKPLSPVFSSVKWDNTIPLGGLSLWLNEKMAVDVLYKLKDAARLVITAILSSLRMSLFSQSGDFQNMMSLHIHASKSLKLAHDLFIKKKKVLRM